MLSISAEASTSGRFSPESRAVAVGFGSNVLGGADKDVITISAKAFGSAAASLNIDSYGVYLGSVVDGGDGADRIEINVSNQSSLGAGGDFNVIGVNRATVNGGNGKDVIQINVSSSNSTPNSPVGSGTYLGLFQGSINGGLGHDLIEIDVTGNSRFLGGSSVGVRQGTLNGDSGKDTFFVRGVNLDLDDAIINGGDGVDVFDTGIGTAEIDGGKGWDFVKLDFFDNTTMSISLLGDNSIEIVGTENKRGQSSNWTQTITNVEAYEVGNVAYNAAEVVDLLG